MARPVPLYTLENCTAAYQLNWSLSLFGRDALPPIRAWQNALTQATEADGVRVLEQRLTKPNLVQFLLSSKPDRAPPYVVRSIKGRLQYLVRERRPRAFRRNYRIESVGAANSKALDKYIGGQTKHHPMADSRVQKQIESLQFHDPSVDLQRMRYSSHGQFVYNLHVVLENEDNRHEIDAATLLATRAMILRSARTEGYRLSRIGLLSNHLHVALGCDINVAPSTVALSFMNNVAYLHQMRPVLRFSFYVGSFGPYDRNLVRRTLNT